MQAFALSNTGKGAILMVLCMSVIGLVDNFVVLIAQESGLWQFHLIRALMICATIVVLARLRGWRLWPRRWSGVLLRSGFGAVSMAIYFGSLAMMPIAQVGAGMFTAPIFVLLFSVILYRQTIGFWRIAAVALGFGGAMLVLQPDFAGMNLWGLAPMAAGLAWSLCVLSTRHLCEGETTATLIFWFFGGLGLLGATGLLVIAVFGPFELAGGAEFISTGWVTPTPRFLFWVSVQAVGSLIAIAWLTRAYQIGETSYIAIFEYSFLIFAGFWGWILWGDTLGPLALVGVGAIVLSGTVIALRSGPGRNSGHGSPVALK